MAVIQSAGQLTELERGRFERARLLRPSIGLYGLLTHSYGQIVRTQPNVRTVISFISRNIAQLGIGLHRFVAEDNRERVREHPFLETIKRPNPLDRRSTRYRFTHNLVWDICTYDVAFHYLIEVPGRQALIRLNPERIELEGTLWPEVYRYKGPRGKRELDPARIIHYQGSANVEDPNWGLPPIESLRRILAEEAAAGEYREQFWKSGARLSGWIERPTSAPDWSDPARTRFKEDWDGLYTGEGPAAGGTPILEDDMKFHAEAGADAQSAQYIEAHKLSREESAAAYHIDPLWVGIHGTGEAFASVVERHKALYQDDLGPWVEMLEDDFTYQALPLFDPEPDRLYIKLNIAAKLRGSITDQAESINRLVGRPILTPNEGRALIDRNPVEGGDGLTVPLNVIVGGQTIPGELVPGDSGEASRPPATKALDAPKTKAVGITPAQRAALEAEHRAAHIAALERTFERQEAEVLSTLGAVPTAELGELFDRARWDEELAADLLGLAIETAGAYGLEVADALGFDTEELDLDVMLPYLATNAEYAAANINAVTEDELAGALIEEDRADAIKTLFAGTVAARAGQIAQTRVTNVGSFAANDTARQAGRSNKVWVVTSSNSRHPGLDGESVPIGGTFSNGLAWPGDSSGSADQTAGCTCFLDWE